MKSKKMIISFMCISLSGCSAAKILMNSEDPRSGFTQTSTTTMYVKSYPCLPLFSAELPILFGTIAYNIISNEVDSWVQQKINAYTFSYAGNVNYYNGRNGEEYQQMCLTFNRNVLIDNKETTALSFEIDIIRLDNSNAFEVVLRNVDVKKTGAITTKNKGIDLIVTLAISTLVSPSENKGLQIISNSTLVLSNLGLDGKDAKFISYGSIFNAIPSSTPLSITIAVTEKGKGVENFKSLQNDIKNNKDIVKSILDLKIKEWTGE